MWRNLQETEDLFAFTEEIFSEKLGRVANRQSGRVTLCVTETDFLGKKLPKKSSKCPKNKVEVIKEFNC